MCHTTLALHSLNVRIPPKYVPRMNVIHILRRNPHTIPINLITIPAPPHPHAILFLESV